jgi:uncharacterized protein (DUF1684 family)
MFKNKLIAGIAALGILGIVYYSLSSSPSYAEQTLKTFEEYKERIRTMQDSPLKDKGTFDFFEPNKDWIVEADFRTTTDSVDFQMDMTDSTKVNAVLAGKAQFAKDGIAITVFIFDEGESYLLPFRDLSNGKDTYGGGRYLNIPKADLIDGKITLDFNATRNYYCAYTSDYICPVPPKENTLPLVVNAGEKNFIK